MSALWPAAGGPVDDPEDEDKPPAEGTLLEVSRVDLMPDERFPINNFLVISFADGSSARFRMKKSTAVKLHIIMGAIAKQARENRPKMRIPSGFGDAEDFKRIIKGTFS